MSEEVDMYISLSSYAMQSKERLFLYVLECPDYPGQTVQKMFKGSGTAHEITLSAIIAAAYRLKKPCKLTIHAKDDWVLLQIVNGCLDRWISTDFVRASGDKIKNYELWQEVAKITAQNDVKIDLKKHPYEGWADMQFAQWIKD